MNLSFAITVIVGWCVIAVPVAFAAAKVGGAIHEQARDERAEHAELIEKLIGDHRNQLDRYAEQGRLERESLSRHLIALSGAPQAANLARIIQADNKAHTPADIGTYMERLGSDLMRAASEEDGLPRGATLVGMGD